MSVDLSECAAAALWSSLLFKVEDKEEDDDDASDLGLLSLGASLRRRRKTKKESQKPPAADDGAPAGKSYQAESPDEGALVSAAATVYGVRLVNRRANGLVLSRDQPSRVATTCRDRVASRSPCLSTKR